MPSWIKDFYAAGDAGRAEESVSYMAPDIKVQFGAFPVTTTRDEALANLAEMTKTVQRMSHEFVSEWDVEPDVSVFEMRVTYTRTDGSEITLPATSIIRHADQQIREMRVYIDPSPLFATIPA